jgi:hypothetical protein
MLLNVLADQWHRVRKSPALDLRKGFGDVEEAAKTTPPSIREDLQWRTFGYNLVRAYVFGDAKIPLPPNGDHSTTRTTAAHTKQSAPLTLMSVFNAFERRQKQWHGVEPSTDEFPSRLTCDLSRGYTVGMSLTEVESAERHAKEHGDGPLCLKIVHGAKAILKSLDTKPPVIE